MIRFDNYLNNVYSMSKFNQQIDNLSNPIQNLTFGFLFNQLVNNLPNPIQPSSKLNFGL